MLGDEYSEGLEVTLYLSEGEQKRWVGQEAYLAETILAQGLTPKEDVEVQPQLGKLNSYHRVPR